MTADEDPIAHGPGPTGPGVAAPGEATAAERGPRTQLLLALCGAGFVAFNFPLLIVWDADVTVFGLPLLPVALFAIWAALIAALATASERRPKAVPTILPTPAQPGDVP